MIDRTHRRRRLADAAGRADALRQAGDLQHGSGQPIHQ